MTDRYVDNFFEHPLPCELPPTIRERLRAENITTVEQWKRLGARRLTLFGITARMVAQIDLAVVEARS